MMFLVGQPFKTGSVFPRHGFHLSNLPPLKQFKSGIAVDKIECKESLVLVTRHDGSPACVKPWTEVKLIDRGWANLEPKTITGLTQQKKTSPELMPLDIASVEDRHVHLNPADMCATISLRLLSPDDLKQTKSGTKDVVFFELDEKSISEFPVPW